MKVERIAAFADDGIGGNPAGIVICDSLPAADDMQALARDVGYSETAFAALTDDAWRVRYFAPESEVPFCGHATIALGAALAKRHGDKIFPLQLNDARITVEAFRSQTGRRIALQSPATSSRGVEAGMLQDALALFALSAQDLDPALPASLASAGAWHLVFALRERSRLSAMAYDLDAGREFMRRHGLTTISLLWIEASTRFHSRNAFASGGVLEDPATGAAAAALGGYLRDIGWPHACAIDIVQGEDMGMRSLLKVEISEEIGASVRVSGATRIL